MNIFLIGYRCTGKTSASKILAESLNWDYIDADVLLVEEEGRSIADIVADEGWASFRKKEKALMKRICEMDKRVIATGGGVILDPENVENMRKSGPVIWLKASPDIIKARIVQDQTTEEYRPSLTSKGLLEEIEEILNERYDLYKGAMTFSLDTDTLSIEDISDRIMHALKEKQII